MEGKGSMLDSMLDVIQENFFVIDSDKLQEVKTKLYGYAFIDNQAVEDPQISHLEELDFDGRGAYVYFYKENDKIKIKQDFMGSFGLYLYQTEGYFAISNSFLKLVEYLKDKVALSLNEDYANFFVVADVCFTAYSETMVNEISVIPRNAIVSIDISSATISYDYINYGENTVDIDSEEAMNILDDWVERWIKTIRYAKEETNDIMVDLSGGFDSRLPFILLLKSGINVDDIKIHSITDGLHTHAEDLEIATEIADYYGFELNNTKNQSTEHIKYNFDEQVALSFYTKLGIHKQMFYKQTRRSNRRYMMGGAGGECIRGYWDYEFDGFEQKEFGRCGWLSKKSQRKVKNSIHKLLCSAQSQLGEKYGMDDLNSREMVDHFFTDIYSRNHFGKDAVENYLSNSFRLSPLLDPQLHRIKVRNKGNADRNLLMAVIFVRYEKKLLDFRFDGGRSIDKEIVQYAEKINAKYPLRNFEIEIDKNALYHNVAQNYEVSPAIKARNYITRPQMDTYIKPLFCSPKLARIIEWGAPCKDVYEFAMRDMESRTYQPLSNAYTMIALGRIIMACAESRAEYGNEMLNFLHRLDIGVDSWDVVVSQQIEDAKKEQKQLKLEIKTLNKEKAKIEKQLQKKQKELNDVYDSHSYKCGKAATWLPRKVKRVFTH